MKPLIDCNRDTMCARRKKPKEGSNTSIANTLMEGICRTWMMMREQESSYTALRGGMEEQERDELDGAVRTFVSDCSERIDEMKQRMTAGDQSRSSVDERAHLKVQTQFTHPQTLISSFSSSIGKQNAQKRDSPPSFRNRF